MVLISYLLLWKKPIWLEKYYQKKRLQTGSASGLIKRRWNILPAYLLFLTEPTYKLYTLTDFVLAEAGA